MKKFILILLFISIGCTLATTKTETGNPIHENDIKLITDGKTTAMEILRIFGSPASISTAGLNDFFIYKYCENVAKLTHYVFTANVASKESCNILTIIINKNTGIVQNHIFEKEVDAIAPQKSKRHINP